LLTSQTEREKKCVLHWTKTWSLTNIRQHCAKSGRRIWRWPCHYWCMK